MSDIELEFSVDSQLLGELGERLVTRNYIALAELVKNAYDADATNIAVRFINASRSGSPSGGSEIQLVDDGHDVSVGMFYGIKTHITVALDQLCKVRCCKFGKLIRAQKRSVIKAVIHT